jgi:hypothetical protein
MITDEQRRIEELEFMLWMTGEELTLINLELKNAFDIIEELNAENGKLIKTVEDMEVIIKKAGKPCACTRVWE